MVDLSGCESQHSWVCPNDRQLALRARLNTGWSMKTHKLQKYGYQAVVLSPTEREIICSVIRRAEELDHIEQERVGKLVEQLNNMKKNVHGGRNNECILCGYRFGLCSTAQLCKDCNKPVCKKCGIELLENAQKDAGWRCKICSETREIWKKSGAWFFKALPQYILPPKKQVKPVRNYTFKARIVKPQSVEKLNEDSNSSQDVLMNSISHSSKHKNDEPPS